MYQEKGISCAVIALLYFSIYCLFLYVSGLLVVNGSSWYPAPYFLSFFAAIAIVWWRGKNWADLGFTKSHLKTDTWIALAIVGSSFILGLGITALPLPQLLWKFVYFLFYIAAVEEIIFRGFLQSYLFGLPWNRYLLFGLGGIFFMLTHIPFQAVIGQAQISPQLVLIHLAFCYITAKRGNVMIPIALHFAIDFLQFI